MPLELLSLCNAQGMPSRPFAPVVKAYPSGVKASNTKGEVLYNANEVEPHVALKIMDKVTRLILADRLLNSQAIDLAGGQSSFDADSNDNEKKESNDPPPAPMWNGPPPPQRLPWGGDGGSTPRLGQIGH